ncbi:ABC transporter permease [Pseudonocardia sp. S2-4]|uniref:ABC transporter permease n=1 Tax=Pseudonocardia humida TaxID=2800819 RepID=A0ABT0ZVW1_9PSEU|nr:ABC transporter permease [Pseudonocardia humida]
MERVQHVLHANPILGPLAVLVLAVLAFSLVSGRFLSAANLGLVLAQVTVIATLALGQTLIILTAGIDLSVGAIAVFSSILMANMATGLGVPGALALLIGFVLGIAMGALNGLLVTRLKLPPFIVTLGTLSIFFSLNSVISRSETVRGADMPAIMTWTGDTFGVGGFRITYGSIIMLLLFAVFFYALGNTAWGKHVYATGDDIEAARLAGIRTDRVLLSVYTVAGLIYAIGAWILMGRLASASPNVGVEYNLDSITAVVLGGTSLFGGRGLVLGTLVGALIVGVFRNGLQLGGVDVVWQGFAIGLLVLVAVAIDQWIRKVRA